MVNVDPAKMNNAAEKVARLENVSFKPEVLKQGRVLADVLFPPKAPQKNSNPNIIEPNGIENKNENSKTFVEREESRSAHRHQSNTGGQPN